MSAQSLRGFDIPGAPQTELRRSPAAMKVAGLAAGSGLLMTHFEYRSALSSPAQWLPIGRDDLGEPASWQGGVLPESKYHSFRTDLMIGSFHPGHRAKWTTHELCHGLVGFAWRPDASRFFHATAARLAELLPVALFYFFDEAHLNRCSQHQDLGPLFHVFCPQCEVAALKGPRASHPGAEQHSSDGKAFIERELSAVRRSLQIGQPIASPWGSLDLCSDGLAYASMQYGRLSSPEFARFMDMFYPPGSGSHDSLDALITRILELTAYLLGEGDARPWPVSRDQWKARDIAWRLFEIRAQAEGEPVEVIDSLLQQLARSPANETLESVTDQWEQLCEDYHLPEPNELFSVGYRLTEQYGFSVEQITEGLESACPLTFEKLGPAAKTVAGAFAAADQPARIPLGLRFADWAEANIDQATARLARFEATVAHLPPRDVTAVSLNEFPGDGGLRLNPGVRMVKVPPEVMDILEMPVPPEERDRDACLIIRRNNDGEPEVVHPEPHIADWLELLEQGKNTEIPEGVNVAALGELVIPCRWRQQQ